VLRELRIACFTLVGVSACTGGQTPTQAQPKRPPVDEEKATLEEPTEEVEQVPSGEEGTFRPTAPEPQPAATLEEAVADLAVVSGHGLLHCTDGTQCVSKAAWARCSGSEARIAAGDQLRLIGPEGVTTVTLEATKHGLMRVRADTELPRARPRLATRHILPPPDAALRPSKLEDPGPDARRLARSLGKGHRPIGELRGTFGDGVDRLLVVETQLGPSDHDAEERVLAIAGNEARGLLPLELVTFIQPTATVDLNADGVDEVLWVAQADMEELVTELHVSYVEGGELHVRHLADCTFSGCEAFMPEARCRPGSAKSLKGLVEP
jgi:hypothetical protein